MESIISMHDEIYPVKSRRQNKSLTYFTSAYALRRHTFYKSRSRFRRFYQSMKIIIAQRTLYILGIINLLLAVVAIVCVAHAEDHPESFYLVYISISIFLFYMLTIVFIIILQIIETYQERKQWNNPNPSTIIINEHADQKHPMIVESLTTQIQPKTRLSRSYTIPISNPRLTLSPSTSSSTATSKEFHPFVSSSLTKPQAYQSFALTTMDQLSSSSLIKPIPLKSQINKTKQ